jgi:hypothetical protein
MLAIFLFSPINKKIFRKFQQTWELYILIKYIYIYIIFQRKDNLSPIQPRIGDKCPLEFEDKPKCRHLTLSHHQASPRSATKRQQRHRTEIYARTLLHQPFLLPPSPFSFSRIATLLILKIRPLALLSLPTAELPSWSPRGIYGMHRCRLEYRAFFRAVLGMLANYSICSLALRIVAQAVEANVKGCNLKRKKFKAVVVHEMTQMSYYYQMHCSLGS